MRKTEKVSNVCALALAMLLGVAGNSAAEPTKTELEIDLCLATRNVCGADCVVNFDNCIEASSIDFCNGLYNLCSNLCNFTFKLCLADASKSAAKKLIWVTSVLDSIENGQITILTRLAPLSGKLDNLAAQVGAALPVDLAPLPSTPGSTDPLDFCQSPAFQKLDVHVTNQGSVPSPASTTHVDFANSGGVDLATPALAPGGSAIVEFTIPTTCFDASHQCSFTIVVDSANAVTESNETNNSAAGLCDAS